jgi:hypothetical protein
VHTSATTITKVDQAKAEALAPGAGCGRGRRRLPTRFDGVGDAPERLRRKFTNPHRLSSKTKNVTSRSYDDRSVTRRTSGLFSADSTTSRTDWLTGPKPAARAIASALLGVLVTAPAAVIFFHAADTAAASGSGRFGFVRGISIFLLKNLAVPVVPRPPNWIGGSLRAFAHVVPPR